ncbi:hypothetical protein OPT61_g162 [Boeremia exigua]|uniref:Uncharacterized protein n=1 Tax=Boeremia exigua TaxID=749465 RepID=A0ACC2IV61_9PLEO|nr:hypothetical protein OPT61_g162 [Boeremia exigua]
MDEKGFAIGVLGKSKRIFDRRAWEKGEVRQSLQDGNREWVSLLACICADGTALPPSVIFASKNSTIRARWVAEIDPETHPIHATSSPTGWTNNDIGLAWLTQVFDRYTKRKALQSTQTLQPLDVVCFKPLSSNYSKELSNYLQASQGLSPIGKPEFLRLFSPAWMNTFTETVVFSAFRATGISPPNADVILNRFRHTSQSCSPSVSPGTSAYSGEDWLKACSLLRAKVKDPRSRGARKLGQTIHHLSIQNELLNEELQLPLNEEYHGGAMMWSPRTFQQARARMDEQAEKDREEASKKAGMKELRAANKRYNDRMAEERRAMRVREKEDQARVNAEKAAQVAKRKAKEERQKQARDAEKAIQSSQIGKRKTSQAAGPRKKQNRGGVGGGSQPIVAKNGDARALGASGRWVSVHGKRVIALRKLSEHVAISPDFCFTPSLHFISATMSVAFLRLSKAQAPRISAVRSFSSTSLRLQSPVQSVPYTESCPSPTCACASAPPDLDIDRKTPLLNTMAPYTEQVLLCTGKEDWTSNLEDDEGATADFVKGLKGVIGKGGEAFDPFTNVLITASSLPASETPNSTTAYLFPSFRRIDAIQHTRESFSNFATAYLKAPKLHPMHDGLSAAQKAVLTRDTSKAALVPAPKPITKPTILICGHGGRDQRCGVLGPILQQSFRKELERKGIEADVAQISHIGGHKYAGNVIIYLPPSLEGNALKGSGIWYGRVGPGQVEGVIEETVVQGRVVGELLRGGVIHGGGNIGRIVEAQLKAERGEEEVPGRLRLRPRARA